jgi:hypothetical protein
MDKNDDHTTPNQCTQNQVGEGGFVGIDIYCPESTCINTRLHALHIEALATSDAQLRATITAEIDTYLVPCATLRRCAKPVQPREMAGDNKQTGSIGLTCMCSELDTTHTIHLKGPSTCKSVELPIQVLFLLPADEIKYTNLPDLGIFIRATMTKKFFTSGVMLQHRKIHSLFTSGNKKSGRKKFNTTLNNDASGDRHWMEKVANSWFVSLLLETIPCLNRYKRGFKHTYDAQSVTPIEVQSCLQIMHGTLLKLYPRGSKTPTFGARVNMVYRIQEIMELPQEDQMTFVTKYPSLVKLCLMEYCYNVLLDFFPVEYRIVCAHASMQMYETTARVMFDTFRRDVINTGLEDWHTIDSKVISRVFTPKPLEKRKSLTL